MTHWPVLLFIARLTKSTFGLKVAGISTNPGKVVDPYLCQYLFECQSTQSVSSVFTGGRYDIIPFYVKSSLDWFVIGYSIARSHATCLWNVRVETNHQIEMLAKGTKYTLDTENEVERRAPRKERGRIMTLDIVNPSDIIMHNLSPYTQHLTELTFRGQLPEHTELLFERFFTRHPMLKSLNVSCPLTPTELLALVKKLPKFENLAQLELRFGSMFFENTKNLLILALLQSCPLLTELTLNIMSSILPYSPNGREMGSALVSYKQPLLVKDLKVIELQWIDLNSSAAEALSCPLQSQHCSLVTLKLQNCFFLSEAFKLLAIGKNTSLRNVICDECLLDSADFKILAHPLRENKTLQEV